MRPDNAGNIAKQLQQKKQLQLQCRQQLAHEGQEATKKCNHTSEQQSETLDFALVEYVIGLYYILIASEDAQLYGLYPNVNSSQSIVRELRAQLKPPSLQVYLGLPTANDLGAGKEAAAKAQNGGEQAAAIGGVAKKREDLIIVNIDEASGDDELAVAEYAEDIYKFYKLTEGESQVCDYMGKQPDIDERMRSILVD
ncbi:hypothetical protein Dimus_005845 [Dionaea muscipula]